MSSNIRINRVCLHCGSDFIAKTTSTRYCSHKCNSAAYKAKIRGNKILMSDSETKAIKLAPIEQIKAKEFLTVNDVATLINCSKRTAYRLISIGTIPSINLSQRKTIVRRSDIENLFETPQVVKPKPNDKEYQLSECYSLSQIESIYRLSNSAVYEVIKRNKIPKIKKGWYTYVPKELITSVLGTPDNVKTV